MHMKESGKTKKQVVKSNIDLIDILSKIDRHHELGMRKREKQPFIKGLKI